ncbi:MAG: exo-alpha-sialidase, partial [Vicinamibacterales bacterium]
IKKVGNAVVFAGPDGRLWLVYVTVSVGGWSGSSLNVTLSSDRGRTWTPSRRLTVSPFFNLAELVKNTPVPLEGGGWAVPMHHEFVARFAEVLWLHEQDGEIRAAKTRITGGRSHFQPALVPLDQSRAVAILRDWSEARVVSVSRTGDGGQTWSAPEPADLPNPDAGVDAIRLEDGRLLLAFNDSLTGRGDLSLALSSDEGHTWQRVATLEEEPEPAGDFSYPSLLLSRTGDVHLVYTWKRTAIKHAVFNTAWLDERRSQQPR